jgi:hypothetical protein
MLPEQRRRFNKGLCSGTRKTIRIRASLQRCRQSLRYANGFSRWLLRATPTVAKAGPRGRTFMACLKACPDTRLFPEQRRRFNSRRARKTAAPTLL